MDSIIKKSENLLEVLELSVSSNVVQLNKDKLDRAFEWTTYFKKVYEKVAQNPGSSSELDERLRALVVSKNHTEEFFNLETLQNGPQILYRNLLSNPDFPSNLIPVLSRMKVEENCSSKVTFINNAVDIIHQKAVLRHLQNILDQIKHRDPKEELPTT